jgi:hypothetical protein
LLKISKKYLFGGAGAGGGGGAGLTIVMMAKITDRAFFAYLSANGVADVYSEYDGPTKLGWRKLFQQQQPSVQQGH